MSNLKIQEIKCERCQIGLANTICQSCQPFHYFCSRCDSIVHSMRVRASHIRQNLNSILNNSLNTQSMSTNKYSNHTVNYGKLNNELNIPKSLKYYRNSTPTKQTVIINNNDNYYGKDYMNEINRIHNKEIESLIYKINIIENNNERLKLNYQNEIELMEERINNILKEKKRLIQEDFKEKEEILNNNLEQCNNKIEELKNELLNEKKNNSNMHKKHINKITEIVNSNNNDIKNLNELHKKEINELYYDGKFKNEKLMEQIENSSNKIEYLIYENEKLREENKKLENDNEKLINVNNNLKIKIEEINKNMEISRDLNKNIQKNYEK